MDPGKLLSSDEELGVYQPAAEDRGIDGEEVADKDADQGKSSSSSEMSSLNRDGLQFDDLDTNYESGEDYEYVRGAESDEADSDGSESEPDGSGSGSESESESDWSEHHAFLFDPFLDEWSIKNEEELEKYYDVVYNFVPFFFMTYPYNLLNPELINAYIHTHNCTFTIAQVFNLEKTRGRFFNCLEDLQTGGVFYRSVKNRVNTAIIHYNKKNVCTLFAFFCLFIRFGFVNLLLLPPLFF